MRSPVAAIASLVHASGLCAEPAALGRVPKLSGYVQGDQIIWTLLAWQAFDARLGHGLTQQGQQFSARVESIFLNAAALEPPRDGPVDEMEGCIGSEAKWWCKGIAPHIGRYLRNWRTPLRVSVGEMREMADTIHPKLPNLCATQGGSDGSTTADHAGQHVSLRL